MSRSISTEQEAEILRLLKLGLSVPQIARRCRLAKDTVRARYWRHRGRLLIMADPLKEKKPRSSSARPS